MRKKVVQTAQQSSRTFIPRFVTVVVSFFFTCPGFSTSPLLTTWFPLPASPSCKRIEPIRMQEYDISDAVLKQRLGEIRTALQNRNAVALAALFHPRLQMQTEMIAKVLETEANTVGQRHEISDYQLWALRPQEKDHNEVQCEEEPIVIKTLYGYPLQMAYWVQSSGNEDLGRFFMLLVQDRTTWRIGAFRFQRWTYMKKEAEGWMAAAALSDQQKKPLEAFFARELAQKLLAGETLFTLPQVAGWQSLQAQRFPKAELDARVQKSLAPAAPVYIAPALSPKGHALLLRFVMEKEWSSLEIRAHCEKVTASILNDPDFSFLQGVRCGYLFPREVKDQDGIMGSVYVERK